MKIRRYDYVRCFKCVFAVFVLVALTGCGKNFDKRVHAAAEAAQKAGFDYCGCAELDGSASFWANVRGRGVACLKVGDVDMSLCMTAFGYPTEE